VLKNVVFSILTLWWREWHLACKQSCLVHFWGSSPARSKGVEKLASQTTVNSTAIQRACQLKLIVLVFRCLHDMVPRYLTDDIRHVADTNRWCLHSLSSALLTVGPKLLVTMGNHVFPVAGSRLWNSLPHNITSAPTLPVFCSHLKTYLFQRSFSF